MSTGRLTTAEAARRLGVKPQTVYAYVSRGLLHSTRDPGGRGSWFDAAEVERLVARSASRGGGPEIRTALTLISGGRLYYRGRDAVELAREETFESVADWLWRGQWREQGAAPFTAPPEVLRRARAAVAVLPPTARLTDQLRTVVTVAAAADPLRFHTQPADVVATGATLLAAMVDALPVRPSGAGRGTPARPGGTDGGPGGTDSGPGGTDGGPDGTDGGPDGGADGGAERGPSPAGEAGLAVRLWPRLTDRKPWPAGVAVLNSALVLLADHDLAASTLAARVAASTRAHPYAVVTAGLAALDGPLHGNAVSAAYRLLGEAIASGDPVGAYAERLRSDGRVAGFVDHAHLLYPEGDIRAAALLGDLSAAGLPEPVQAAVTGLVAAASSRSPRHPNIDFGLAVLCHAFGMPPDAGEAIFAIARTAGWIAHALEEYAAPGQRFRLTGSYVGEQPQ